jgi:hypothetical protein
MSSPGQTEYIIVLLSSLLSSQHLSALVSPYILISTQTDIPVAGSLQLYLGTHIDTPPPHGLCLGHTGIITVTTTVSTPE